MILVKIKAKVVSHSMNLPGKCFIPKFISRKRMKDFPIYNQIKQTRIFSNVSGDLCGGFILALLMHDQKEQRQI